MPETPPLHLTKHHGAGNDFLVSIDLDDRAPLGTQLVRALCDRRFGIGADGVIRILPGDGDADLTMELRNADGSVAEMSGNGMRCLAQAAVAAGLVQPPAFRVMTMAGVRSVEYRPAGDAGGAVASVDMGVPTLGPDQPEPVGECRARQVNVGNPHLVLLASDPSHVDVVGEGYRLQAVHPGGINVEFIAIGPGDRRHHPAGVGAGSGGDRGLRHRQHRRRRRRPQLGPGGRHRRRAQPGRHAPGGAGRRRGPVDRAGAQGGGHRRGRGRGPGGSTVVTPTDSAFTDTLISRTVRERIVLVGVTLPHVTLAHTEAGLDELALLVDTAGADVVDRVMQRRSNPDPATFLGRGKAEELLSVCLAADADTVVFDHDLSPAQQRNLEKILGRTAIDRTAVILDIFAQNARTPEGRAQVELALLALPAPEVAGPGQVVQPAGRWDRYPGPGGDQAGGRPAPPGATDDPARVRPPSTRPDPTDAASRSVAVPTADGVPGRLHQRGEVHPPQPAVLRRCAGGELPPEEAELSRPGSSLPKETKVLPPASISASPNT